MDTGIHDGVEDRSNVSRRVREGWELVKGTELPPEWDLPMMDNGRNEGVVYNEDFFGENTNETIEERTAYYSGKTEQAKEALDNICSTRLEIRGM